MDIYLNRTRVNSTSISNSSIPVVTLGLISFVAVVGNSFNLMVIHRCRSLHSVNTYLIANLAIVDFMTGFITLPVAIIVLLKPIYKNPVLCQLQAFLVVLFYGASLSTTTAISFDRCIAITHPYYYNSVVAYQRFIVQVVILWLLPLIMAICPLVGLGRYLPTSNLCWINISKYQHNYVITLILIFYIFVAITVTVICNIIILVIAYQKGIGILTGRRNIKKSIKTTSLIVGTKLITWLPFSIIFVMDLARKSAMKLPHGVRMTSILLICSNAASNPIIYLLTNQNLTSKLKLWLRYKSLRINVATVAPLDHCNQGYTSGNLIAIDKTT
ncbi:Alpha-1A adrenergic receptor [Trichoplax sp. H2]|nr:Alpha-1A adrenergic receptor [Trichoplax sp. H2]|eukprot:RDD40414.1 Alpha-1A adrenergic receptor [Trichoplax sp. H2]